MVQSFTSTADQDQAISGDNTCDGKEVIRYRKADSLPRNLHHVPYVHAVVLRASEPRDSVLHLQLAGLRGQLPGQGCLLVLGLEGRQAQHS